MHWIIYRTLEKRNAIHVSSSYVWIPGTMFLGHRQLANKEWTAINVSGAYFV